MLRKPFSTVAVTVSLLFVAGVSLYVAGEMPRSSHVVAPGEQKSSAPAGGQKAPTAGAVNNQQPAPGTSVTPIVAPPGTELHTIAKGETVPGLLRATLPRTKYMTLPEFEAALRQQNPGLKGLFPKPGTVIIV